MPLTKPYEYQWEAAKRVHRFGGRALIAAEMGTGKSLMALLWAEHHPEARPIVIVCPKSLKWNWARECSVHMGWNSRILESKQPEQRHGFELRPSIVIVNYDILTAWLDYLQKINPQLVIIDETGSYLGSRSSQRTRAVKTLCQGVPHVIALSGTPLVNRPSELWPTLNILRPSLFTSFWNYAHQYCAMKRTHWGWDFSGASRLLKLHGILDQNVMVRYRKVDVLPELPDKRRIVLPLPITNRREYNHALDNFLDWLAKTKPEKLSKARKAQRLVQMGYLKRLAALGKLKATEEWINNFLSESDGKLVLFAVHKEVIKSLRTQYGRASVVVDGSVTGKDRRLAVEKFQRNDKCRLFIGNIKAAGVGLTLTAADTVAFVEFPWAPGDLAQGIDRLHRIGQKKTVTAYMLVATNTIEEWLCELLQKKQKILDAVLDNGEVEESLDIFDQLESILLRERLRKAPGSPRNGLQRKKGGKTPGFNVHQP